MYGQCKAVLHCKRPLIATREQWGLLLGCPLRTVTRAIDEAQTLGWITVTPRFERTSGKQMLRRIADAVWAME